MVYMKLKVGDKVKVIKPVVIAGTNLLGFTGTVECLASAGVDAVYVDYGAERAVDFFFFDELELIQ